MLPYMVFPGSENHAFFSISRLIRFINRQVFLEGFPEFTYNTRISFKKALAKYQVRIKLSVYELKVLFSHFC